MRKPAWKTDSMLVLSYTFGSFQWIVLHVIPLFLLITNAPVADAQMTTCSDGSTGYNNIAAINNDIKAEVARIKAGGTPKKMYLYRLCPNTSFTVTGNNGLVPLLSGSVFQCGNSGNPADKCQITGGTNQVVIPTSPIPGYQIKNIEFNGVSFGGFSGSAISGNATGVTTVTLNNAEFSVSLKCLHHLSSRTCQKSRRSNISVCIVVGTVGFFGSHGYFTK